MDCRGGDHVADVIPALGVPLMIMLVLRVLPVIVPLEVIGDDGAQVGVDLAGECGEDDAVVAFLAEVTKKVSEWVFLVEELAPRVLDVVKEET